MARYVRQKKHYLALTGLKVIGEIAAQVERVQNAVAKPVIPRLQGVRREHRFLYLTPRRLILLENAERVA